MKSKAKYKLSYDVRPRVTPKLTLSDEEKIQDNLRALRLAVEDLGIDLCPTKAYEYMRLKSLENGFKIDLRELDNLRKSGQTEGNHE